MQTLKGKPASRVVRIDSNPWYESLEFGLQEFAASGSQQPGLCWVLLRPSLEIKFSGFMVHLL